MNDIEGLTCTAWTLDLVLPIPSTVVTAQPCTLHSGTKHATIALCLKYKDVVNILHRYFKTKM